MRGKAINRVSSKLPNEEQGLRKLIDLIEGQRTGGSDAPIHIEWSPETLRALQRTELSGVEIMAVSNREPYIHDWNDDKIIHYRPASGLVSALEPVIRACGGIWIAHGSGTADRSMVDANDHISVPPNAPAYTLRRIWISESEENGYYYGFANEGLWPLCHIAFVRPQFREGDWQAYVEINQRFADAIIREATTEDPLVLVQDYHLALVPRLVRERLPKATIVTFWHIPWPNAETFGVCPWKNELLLGLLGSTILGFHTRHHCNNFLDTVDRFVECRIDRVATSVVQAGHETLIRDYPISIEWPQVRPGHASVEECRGAVRQRLGVPADSKLIVGIERLDFTKGIPERIGAIGELLERHPEWLGRVVFVQAAAPSRSKLPAYQSLKDEVEAAVAMQNERFGSGEYEPLRLCLRHHDNDEVMELLRAADVCIVNSLHDGMNLVAKEFVAARDDERGVLILSDFAGAALELPEALLVNPYDVAAIANALHRALSMSPEEAGERMRQMRAKVRENNVHRWAAHMLLDAAQVRRQQYVARLGEAHSGSGA